MTGMDGVRVIRAGGAGRGSGFLGGHDPAIAVGVGRYASPLDRLRALEAGFRITWRSVEAAGAGDCYRKA